jgi:hypothetical protein
MTRTRLIIFGVALAAGLAAAYLSLRSPREAPVAAAEPPKIAAEEVLVASGDLVVGTRIGARDVKWLAWPTDVISSGMILRKNDPDFVAQSTGAVVRDSFVANEPIRKKKLIRCGTRVPDRERYLSDQVASPRHFAQLKRASRNDLPNFWTSSWSPQQRRHNHDHDERDQQRGHSPVSSRPITPLYPTTSAARIAASLR